MEAGMMNRTFNVGDHLLAKGRNYRHVGRDEEALHTLKRLVSCGDIRADVAEQSHALLAEIFSERRKFRRARHHLGTALLYQPRNARYHHLLANAYNSGSQRDT